MAAAAVAPSGPPAPPSGGPPPVACPQCGNFWGVGSLFVRDTCGHRKCRGCVIVEGNECGTCSLQAGGGGGGGGGPPVEQSNGAPPQEKEASGASGGPATCETESRAGGPAPVPEAAAGGAQPVNKNVKNNATASSTKKSDLTQHSSGKKVLDELNVTNASNVAELACEDTADAEAVDDPSRLPESERPTAKRPAPPSHGVVKLPGLPVTYCCTICGHKFKSRSNVRYHYYCGVENKPLTCELCKKGFVSKSHYQYHMRDHAGDLPFKCDVCGKGFKQKTKLKRHTIVHTDERKFECATCGKHFAEASHLKVHSRLHTGERPYKCEHCGRGFNERANYSKHVRSVHTDERPYACEMCGKCFARSENLKVHLRRHEGIRPYECPVCSLTFSYKKDMTRHMPVHDSSVRPFECDKCSQTFKRKDNLLRHIKLSHNENENEKEEEPQGASGGKSADAELAPPREEERTSEPGTEKTEETARVEAEKCGRAQGSGTAGRVGAEPGIVGGAEAAGPQSKPDADKQPGDASCGTPSDANSGRPLRKRRVRVPPDPSATSSLPTFRRNVTPPPGALPEPPRVPRHCLPAPRERRAVLRPPVPVDFLEAAEKKAARGRAAGRKRQKREPETDTTDIEKVGFIQVPQYPPKLQPTPRQVPAQSKEATTSAGDGSRKVGETCGAVPVIRRPQPQPQPSNCVRTITKTPQHAVSTIVSPRNLPPVPKPAHTAPPLPPLPACSPRPDQPMLRLLLHDTPCSDAPQPPPAPVRAGTPPAPPASAPRPAEGLGLCDVYECILRGDLGQLAGGRPGSGVRRPPVTAREGESRPAAREWTAPLPREPCRPPQERAAVVRDRPAAKRVPVAGGRLGTVEVGPGTAEEQTAATVCEPKQPALSHGPFPTAQSGQQPWPASTPLPAGTGKQKRTEDGSHPPSANTTYNLDEFDTYCSFVRIRATKQTVFCGKKSAKSTFFEEEQRHSTYAEVRRPGKRMSAISDRLSDDNEEDDAGALNYTVYGCGSGGKKLPDPYAPDGTSHDGYPEPHYSSRGDETSDVIAHLRDYTEQPAVTYGSGRAGVSGGVHDLSSPGDTAAQAGAQQSHVIVGTGKHSDAPYG